MEGVSNETNQLSWNGVAPHIEFVNQLSFKASRLGLNGDFENKFYTLKTLRDNINPFCKSPKIETSKKWEGVIGKAINIRKAISELLENPELLSEGDLRKAEKKVRQIKNFLPEMIAEYHRHLLNCMKEYGHFPKKQDTTYMGS